MMCRASLALETMCVYMCIRVCVRASLLAQRRGNLVRRREERFTPFTYANARDGLMYEDRDRVAPLNHHLNFGPETGRNIANILYYTWRVVCIVYIVVRGDRTC